MRKALEQPEPKQKRLRTDDLYQISGHQSDAQVFRLVTPEARQHLRGLTPLPVRDCAQAYTRPVLREVGADEAKTRVLRGRPCSS